MMWSDGILVLFHVFWANKPVHMHVMPTFEVYLRVSLSGAASHDCYWTSCPVRYKNQNENNWDASRNA